MEKLFEIAILAIYLFIFKYKKLKKLLTNTHELNAYIFVIGSIIYITSIIIK